MMIMLLDNQVRGGRQEVQGGGGGEEEEGGGEDGRSSCKAWHENMKIISQFTVEVLANIFLPLLALIDSSFGLVPIDGMPVQHLHLSRTSVVLGELLGGGKCPEKAFEI